MQLASFHRFRVTCPSIVEKLSALPELLGTLLTHVWSLYNSEAAPLPHVAKQGCARRTLGSL